MRIVPRERMGAAMGLFGLGVLFAPAIGPTLGGYLVEYVNWRLIFYINIPVGVLGLVAALFVLPRFPTKSGERFDFAGFLTVSVGLFALLLALSKGADWGWSSYRILGLIALGVFSLAIFVIIELSVRQPMLDVRVFRYWHFTNSLILVSVLFAGLFGAYFYIPFFLQEGEGLGALQAGLVLLLPALLTGAVMPISGRIYDRFGARWPAAVGCLVVAWGTYLMHSVTPETPRGQMVSWMCIRSVGMGLAFMPIMTSSMAGIPPDEVNRASAVNNIVQRVSSSFGLAVMTSVLTTQMASQYASRLALVPAVQPGFPVRQAMPPMSLYGPTQIASMGGAMGDLMLLTAGITALGIFLSLMLPAKPVGSPMVVEGIAMPPPEEAVPEPPPVAEPAPPPRARRRAAAATAPAPAPVPVGVGASEATPS
jgi:EmrB/QacA subfamily drug resistance transporter